MFFWDSVIRKDGFSVMLNIVIISLDVPFEVRILTDSEHSGDELLLQRVVLGEINV